MAADMETANAGAANNDIVPIKVGTHSINILVILAIFMVRILILQEKEEIIIVLHKQH
jgi:hypothetical protein